MDCASFATNARAGSIGSAVVAKDAPGREEYGRAESAYRLNRLRQTSAP